MTQTASPIPNYAADFITRYEEALQQAESKRAAREDAKRQEERAWLLNRLPNHGFNAEHVTFKQGGDYLHAVLPGLPICFHRYGSSMVGGELRASLLALVGWEDDPALDEWWENPANKPLERLHQHVARINIKAPVDIGEALVAVNAYLEKHGEIIIHPWPEETTASPIDAADVVIADSCAYAWVTLDELNLYARYRVIDVLSNSITDANGEPLVLIHLLDAHQTDKSITGADMIQELSKITGNLLKRIAGAADTYAAMTANRPADQI